MQLWQAAQKLGLENLLNFFVSKSACSMHAKISKEFDMSWSRVLKCAINHPTLRLKRVQSGIYWSLSQMCKNSPHFETRKCTIWHLLKHTSKVQEFTPLWDSKVYNLAFVEACLKCARIHPTWKQEKVTCHFALVSVTCQWINQRQYQPIFILTGVCAEK